MRRTTFILCTLFIPVSRSLRSSRGLALGFERPGPFRNQGLYLLRPSLRLAGCFALGAAGKTVLNDERPQRVARQKGEQNGEQDFGTQA